jgi:adenosylhomocysteine nucleosidase
MLNGIIVAMPQELRTLTQEKLPYGKCYPLSDRWMVILSGIGAKAARAAAGCLLEHNVERLVSWGTAAALDPRLERGALLLPEIVLNDTGGPYHCDPLPGDFLIKQLSGTYFISRAPLFGAAPLLKSPAEKNTLYESSGAVAADMESAAIAVAAREAGRPFAVVRAVSDEAGMVLPSLLWQAIDDRGVVKLPDLLAALMRRPMAIIPLIKLGMGFHQARKSLMVAADLLLEEG